MPIYKTARFEVKAESIGIAKKAIATFIASVKVNEPDTLYYTSWQEKDNPARFLHHFAFKDSKAEEFHKETQWVKTFVATLYPELVSDGVEFTDYVTVSTTEEG